MCAVHEKAKRWLIEMRPAQWTKNIVVLAAWAFAVADPLQAEIFAYKGFIGWIVPLLLAIAMVFSFCLVSSAFYLINDVSDISADSAHPEKKFRPIAAGLISPVDALRGALVLFATGLVFPTIIVMVYPERSLAFGTILAYTFLQCFYTGLLKKLPYVDVAVIAIGFVLRAVAGASVLDARISPWLLICTFCLSLFLALCKRHHEKMLVEIGDANSNSRHVLKHYNPKLLKLMICAVALSTFCVYIAYTLSGDTAMRFGKYHLAPTSIFVFCGMMRYLCIVFKDKGGGRPEKILLTDRWIWFALIGFAISAGVAFVL